jgi:hypothetical protein
MTHLIPALCSLALCLSPALRAGDPPQTGNSLERTLASGGRARLRLSAGEYRIRPSADPGKLRITWHTKHDRDLDRVRVRADAQGGGATIDIKGPMDNFRVEIELPARTDLDVDMSVGAISVAGIEGSKSVDLNIGEVRIEVGSGEDYREARASLSIGDLSPGPFGSQKGGFFRSFNWRGGGKYTLDVRLGIGDIQLTGSR